MKTIFLTILLCGPASAGQAIEKDENVHNQNWACAIQAYDNRLLVPVLEPKSGGSAQDIREAARALAQARKRLLLARQALERMQTASGEILAAANSDCAAVWSAWNVFSSTAEAAVREEETPLVSVYQRSGWKVSWQEEPVSRLWAQLKDVEAKPGRFASVCRQLVPDFELYAPEPQGRAALAKIGETAGKVRAALRAQSEAFDELLPWTQGRRCGELARAFERLAAAQRQAFFNFRQKAVADAFWDGLNWRPAR